MKTLNRIAAITARHSPIAQLLRPMALLVLLFGSLHYPYFGFRNSGCARAAPLYARVCQKSLYRWARKVA